MTHIQEARLHGGRQQRPPSRCSHSMPNSATSCSMLHGGAEQWGKQAAQQPGEGGDGEQKPPEQEPNFMLSGALAKETNTLRGVELLHTEPPEARKPNLRWRLYIFKNGGAPPRMALA